MANENANMPSPLFPANKASPVSLLDALLVIAVTFVLALLIGSFLFLVNISVALVVTELLLLFIPLTYLLFKRINVKTYVKAELKLKFLLLGIGLGVLLLFLNVAVSVTLTAIFGPSQAIEETNRIITDLSKSPSGLIAVVAALSLAGVCEEFAFRGFLQSTINRKYSFIPAVIISAGIFGLFHFDLQIVYTLSAFIIGLFLGYIYHRWNSYVVSAAAHSTVNIIVLIALLATI